LESDYECVTTHLSNLLALKMNVAEMIIKLELDRKRRVITLFFFL